MKHKFRKGLIYVIILLFIGLSVTSSINGNIGKTSNQSAIESPANYPLNNDYVNAYWKFDECEGDTAYDSSGHGYHGTIYGATWTGGYPNCGLDFDGVDDYVDLDAHSEGLGFNKTDDLMFSLYFKSTDSGVIYSLSDETGVDPRINIELNSNGTLEFQAWVENCGISLPTDGVYNDGTWHYVEVIYNGTKEEPTAEIYVDNEFDTSVTEWVCYFYADEFETAKIGRRSNNETGYFDGVIDELKIIKYQGGNQPPNINISGPTSGEAGVEYNYTFLTIDPEGDDIWFYIDWGDGATEEWRGPYESGEEVTMKKVWYENGTYEIRAKARDFWGEGPWSSFIVIIGNRVPNPPVINGPPGGKIGTEYSYTFVAVDPDGDDVKYFIDWDDDNTEWTDYHASGEEVTVKHTWSDEGTYIIQAKAKDIMGEESDWAYLEVTMPHSYHSNWWFLRWLDRFPLLQRLLYSIWD